MAVMLRPYQVQAVRETLEAAAAGLNPVLCLPTGAGKSIVNVELMRYIHAAAPHAKMLSITHRRELIRQNRAAFGLFAPKLTASIYSAGLGEKDLSGTAVFAGVQSLCRADLSALDVSALVVDEVHFVSRSEDTQYGRVLAAFPAAVRVGLSATPYRMDSGPLHEGKGAMFDTLIDNVSTQQLIDDGYLCPIIGVRSRAEMDVRGVHTRAGEFVTSELEEVATAPGCVDRIAGQIVEHAQGRRRVLVFAVSVLHAQLLSEALSAAGLESGYVHGNLDADARDSALAAFSNAPGRAAMVNCMILTTGYDCPEIDCIACVRPTQSKGLFIQIIGRGLRKHGSKTDCKLLDFGGNLKRHAPLDGVPEIEDEPLQDAIKKRAKEKKENGEVKQRKVHFELDESPVGFGGDVDEFEVFDVAIKVQVNKKNAALKQIMVRYMMKRGPDICVWLLPEHQSKKARFESARWFARRGLAMPATAEAAAIMAKSAPLPSSISAKRDGEFWRIVCEHFDSREDVEAETSIWTPD